ncbi:MAG: HD domain-containing protein [Planctomycetota bacterium]
MALLHDIGHPPFGHSGEDALAECLRDHGGFSHNQFALVLAEELETRYTAYPGLNLTREVLAGQDFRITHEDWSPLLEVQVVDLADSITYNAHDVDDALTLGLLQFQQLQGLDLVRRATAWQDQGQRKGNGSEQQRKSLVHSLIDVQVADLVESSREKLASVRGMDQLAVRQLELELALSPVVASEKEQLGQFLFDNVYRHPELMQVRQKAATRIRKLWEKLVAQPQLLPVRFLDRAQNDSIEVAAAHYIAGMTDRFCDSRFQALIESNESEVIDW